MVKITNKQLIEKAKKIAKRNILSKEATSGEVGSALITDKGNVYVGICVNAACGLGTCAEHIAIGAMLTKGESRIKKIVAVSDDGRIVPPCGRCRELISQMNDKNLDTEVILSGEKVVKLSNLLPNRWQKAWDK